MDSLTQKSPFLGYHHITICASSAREDFDFHTGLLGLRCVKKTVLLDGAEPIYHLYYGDGLGHEGTLITAFAMPHRPVGRQGSGQIASIGLAVPKNSLEYWSHRLQERGVPFCEVERFGQLRLAFRHPVGVEYELVPSDETVSGWDGSDVPKDAAIVRVHAVRVSSRELVEMSEFMTDALGFSDAGRDSSDSKFTIDGGGPGQVVEITHEPNRPQGSWGYARNTINHVAFNIGNGKAQSDLKAHLEGLGYIDSAGPVDRNYFYSMYFRSPSGAMFEAAYTSDGGFLKDESLEDLGTELQLPAWLTKRKDEFLTRLGSI